MRAWTRLVLLLSLACGGAALAQPVDPGNGGGGAGGGASPNLPVTTTYTASGAIAVTDLLAMVTCASQCNMTLASGTVDGQRVVVKRGGGGAVKITLTLDGTASSAVFGSSTTYMEAISLRWNAGSGTWLGGVP